jgi:hypothetical protein
MGRGATVQSRVAQPFGARRRVTYGETRMETPSAETLRAGTPSAETLRAGTPSAETMRAGTPSAVATTRAAGGVTTGALARLLAPQRAGDPLGLGIAPGGRPPAPADPDRYDRLGEDADFARSLLSEAERRQVDGDIDRDGYMTIAQVRALVSENTIKGSVEAAGLDPEVMAMVDARINYQIFIAGDNIYTRGELYDHYPFHEFNVQPEAVFVQQEIGVFPPQNHAPADALEYAARDAGDESIDFMMVEDLVGRETARGCQEPRAPLRVVKTKVYVGKERWEDFALLQRFFRGAVRVAAAQIASQGGAGTPAPMSGVLALLAGGAAAPQQILASPPADSAAREAEVARREAALDLREAAAQRRMAESQQKLDADMRRLEALVEALASGAPRAPPPSPAAPPAPAAGLAGGLAAGLAAAVDADPVTLP